jgi:hypothetical protein
MITGDVKARCLAVISRSVKEGNTVRANLVMKAEIHKIAREVSHWQLGGEAKARHLLRPMEEVLVSRHGSQVGRRLYWDFVEAFWLASFPDSSVARSEQGQPASRVFEWEMQG